MNKNKVYFFSFLIFSIQSLFANNHFSPAYLEYSDNPYLAMNIYIISAVLNDLDLETGDEIGVFDGDVCVGMGIVEGTISTTNILSIAVSFQDASWPANTGFSSGNTISYRYWDASASSEVSSIETTYLQGSDIFAQQSSSYVSLIGSGEGSVIVEANPGCMNESACNYDPDANIDDGTCSYIVCDNGMCVASQDLCPINCDQGYTLL